jgi:indole-3-glycerol phosphate synthase
MFDFLDTLAKDALETVESGYYEKIDSTSSYEPRSLKQALRDADGNPIIAEVKAASPSAGYIRRRMNPIKLAGSMIGAGAAGLSVLTEPKHFKGSISYVKEINNIYNCPVLMKDFILSDVQLNAAKRIGASAVLLISTLFFRGYGELELSEMIKQAHLLGLEVLLETHSLKEYNNGLTTDADLIGINNRDLTTLKTNLNVTEMILRNADRTDKLVVSESGIKSASDIRFLRECGADAFLVGSSIMASQNPKSKVRELVEA